ncbi:MAG TPA: hypothetical protein VGQ90_06965 [Stellaceae bacterium]|nr:hypothetical protein [Stellaceae bacterium]
MTGDPEAKYDAATVYRRVLEKINRIPPGPDHIERVLDMLHGPGWKERAMAAGPLTLEFGRRLRELEARVSRIERHLQPSPLLPQWEKTERFAPLAPLPSRK